MSADNTPCSTPEDTNAQDNLMESVDLFNTDIDQEWCGFPDTSSISVTTTVTTSITSSSSVRAFISNNTNTTTTATATTCVVTCVTHDPVTNNSRGNCVQKSPDNVTTNSVVSQFTGQQIVTI